jgi:CxxC-x17-CxxC domain-containing protein
MAFVDKTITCRDCGTEFVFTAGEQEFYASKGFINEPTRCPSCRRVRKAGGGGEGDSRQRGSRGSYESNGPREKVNYTVVCANCGQETTVPFIPRGHRPVYCSACFDQMRQNNRDRALDS